MKLKYKWGLWLMLLIPVLSGCNNSDDVQKIFTGRTWRMTYITEKGEHKWFNFPGVSDEILKSYDRVYGTRLFNLSFNGATTDNVITGSFNGSGSVVMEGTWSANGETNTFTTSVKKSSVSDSKDTLGKYIIEGIKKATSYDGDENNLYLYFEYENKTLYIAFRSEQ